MVKTAVATRRPLKKEQQKEDEDEEGDDVDANDITNRVLFKYANLRSNHTDQADGQIYIPAAPAAVRQPSEAAFTYELEDSQLTISLENDVRRPPERGGRG